MKHNKLTFFSTAAFSLGAFLFLAPSGLAADKETKLNAADSEFIQEEAAAGVALVRIAELGVKQASSADIKAFAGTIVAEQTKANAELAMLARSNTVKLTSEANSKHADSYDSLEDERGAKFDKRFLSVIAKGHKKCLKNFEDAAEDATNSEVKLWAAKRLPTLRAQLERAEELSSAPTTTAPSNTARNERDRDAKTLTPLDQGNSKADIATTAQIRKGILSLEDISVNARNVKIITKEGQVTLRGPVNSEEEKRLIGEIANRIAASGLADNQLEVEAVETTN